MMPATYYDEQYDEWVYQQIKAWAEDHNNVGPSVRKAAELCNIPKSSMEDIYNRLKQRRWIKNAPFGGVICLV